MYLHFHYQYCMYDNLNLAAVNNFQMYMIKTWYRYWKKGQLYNIKERAGQDCKSDRGERILKMWSLEM